MVAGQRGRRRDDDEDDYEELVLELLTAQLRAQQRISSYVGFFFWLALIAVTLAAGAVGAALVAHFAS